MQSETWPGRIDFPTLGDLVDAWIERHCVIPSGFRRGRPFKQYDWQFWCTANHYRVREDVVYDPDDPPLNQAFTYRLTQVIGPQKIGKGPWCACLICVMAAGPDIFVGWARAGDVYLCSENGCDCGWYYEYEPGEPMGGRHPSPLIQLTANSQDQVKTNVWDPLNSMIRRVGSPLAQMLLPRGEFIRVLVPKNADPESDRIDMVTSSARTRLGNPVTHYLQDESGLYTAANGMVEVADTQERGAAGMGGRGIQTTNCWDPAEKSHAQTTFEADLPDVFSYYRNPDTNPDLLGEDGKPLPYSLKANRRKIHAYVYEGASHVNLDSIEAVASALVQRDPAQAERFFANRIVAGGGAWLPDGAWSARRADVVAAAA
jgi:hypothetical protein